MQRLRLKADGRIVELRDGQEIPLATAHPAEAAMLPARMSASRQSRSANTGAGSVRVAVKTKFGILGQRVVATVSVGGCMNHCCGSVGVAGRSAVAGTT